MAWTDVATVSGSDGITSTRQNLIINNINYNRSPLVEETLNIADFSTTSTSFVDVTGVTDAITTTGTVLRIVILFSARQSGGGTSECFFNIDLDGSDVTADAEGLQSFQGAGPSPVTLTYVASGLTAGAHTVQMRAKVTNASYTLNIDNPSIQLIDAA